MFEAQVPGEAARDPEPDDALSIARAAATRAEERLREAIDVLPQGIVFLDADGRYIMWNRQYAEIYRKSADLFAPGTSFAETLRMGIARGDYPEAVGREDEWLEQRLAMLECSEGRHEQWLSDGRCIMIEERRTADGGSIGLRVDITEMKQREESFRLLFESNPVPLLVYDPAGETIRSANLAAAEHFGFAYDDFRGLPAERLFAPDEWREALLHLAANGSEKDRFWRQRAADGSELESVLFTRQSMFDGRLATIVSVFDVTERRKVEARIAHMARHDELTGLANRTHCRERLHEMLHALGDGPERVGVAMLDLDNFKRINDSFGHHVGDSVLAEAARRMRMLVPPGALLCRLGGDEFAVLIPARTDDQLQTIARSITTALAEPFFLGEHCLHIGATIGIAVAPFDTREGPTLLRYADLALYAAKAHKRGTVRRFEQSMDVAAQDKRLLESDFRRAVRGGQLSVHYQPLIDLESGAVVAYEALLRWEHPTRGMLYPDSFVALAEELGLIDVVGQYVLNTACREAAGWDPEIKLAVNVSPLQFRSGTLVGIVIQALAGSGLDPERLELEITEAVLMEKGAPVARQIDRIRSLGVGISMDDFGTGYSSLSYLLSYPFTKIKIDKSFVIGLEDEPNSRAVIQAIINLGRSLGMTVTAEGIEQPEALRYLKSIGCAQGQGYLIGKAKPSSEIDAAFPERRVA